MLPNYNIIEAGAEASVYARAFGRKMIAQLADAGLKNNSAYRLLEDGTELIATRAHNQYRLRITTPKRSSAPAEITTAAIWIPRGFVTLPATDAAPFGWGMPIVQDVDSGATAYSAKNLAPGLDVARWTVDGPLGQVLLTRVANAGYPGTDLRPDRANDKPQRVQPCALLYNPDAGPKPPKAKRGADRQDALLDQATGAWAAYRLELADFAQFKTGEVATSKRAIFELTNKHRTGMSLDALALPIRGYASSSEAYAENMAQAGILSHFAGQFWDTYRTRADRGGKDGMPYYEDSTTADDRNKDTGVGENNQVNAVAGTVTVIGADPNGEDILAVGVTAPPVDPAVAVANWLGSPIHKAMIENTDWNGHSSFLDVGVYQAWSTQNFQRRDQWVACGNAFWYSRHTEVPAISWHSFASMNLAFETWPVSYNNGTGAVQVGTSIVDANGVFWFKYAYGTTADFEHVVPGLGSGIFMRGRMIGIAPQGGLVLGAGMQKIESNLSSVPTVYRLILLVHNEADQPSDKLTYGMTPNVHVYYIDLPDVNGVAAHPASVIRGIYESPVSSGAWIAEPDPWSWRDAGVVNVSVGPTPTGGANSAPNQLKYTQLWRFNSTATQAVCLRDIGTKDDFDSTTSQDGLVPRAVVLTFNLPATTEYLSAPAPALTVTATNKALPPISEFSLFYATPALGVWPYGANLYTFPVAVDFNADGSLQYVFQGDFVASGLSPAPTLQFLATGPATAATYADLSNVTQVAATINANVMLRAQVLDVASASFVVETRHANFTWDGTEAGGTPPNPAATPCFTHTSAPVLNVSVFQKGALLDTRWFGNPDGVVFDEGNLCEVTASYPTGMTSVLFLSQAMSRMVQPSYVYNRAGEWILSYQVSPQPGCFYTVPETPVDACVAHSCAPTLSDLISTNYVNALSDTRPRGGWCAASFGAQVDLAALLKVDGDNMRFAYARVV